jgi:hypothetical protein
MTDNTAVMIHIVEQFIYEKTGKKVKIVFNDPMNMHRHLKMLMEAYYVAMDYNKSK